MQKNILVIGSLNMDLVISMARMPIVSETVLGKDLTYIPGGKGANQAYSIGNLGGNVTMLGCTGQDDFGQTLIQSLSGAGVNTAALCRTAQAPTGTACIYVDAEGHNSIVVVPGANGCCDVPYLQSQRLLFEQADFILLQMEIPYTAVEYAVTLAQELGKQVILNPAPAPDCLPAELLQKLDYLTPNETELAKLGGEQNTDLDSLDRAAQKLLAAGVKNLIVTLGPAGCRHYSQTGFYDVPAFVVSHVVDTTAAGDCFNGAFVLGLSEGMAPREALRFANGASALSVTQKGAQKSIPDRAQTQAFLAQA